MELLYSLVQMVGAVALLLFGTFLIRTGMLRAFGEALRLWMTQRLTSRLSGFAAGIGLSMMLQSSTASALLVASLQKKGLVTTAIALSSVLGADLGSALMVRVLSFNLSVLIPVFLFVGAVIYLRGKHTQRGQIGLIFLGLAFVMMALSMIVTSTAPFRASSVMSGLFATISGVPTFSIAAGVVLALMCFSSLAVVMIAAGLTATGVLTAGAGLWVVLGANLGSAFLALITTAASSPMARRAPAGNCVFRIAAFFVGAFAVATLPQIAAKIGAWPDGVIYFHIAFNAATGFVGLFFVKAVAQVVERWLPEKQQDTGSGIRYLTSESLLSTETALQSVKHELALSVDLYEKFFRDVATLIENNPATGEILLLREQRIGLLKRAKAINAYLTEIMRGTLSVREAANWQRLRYLNANLQFATTVLDEAYKLLMRKKCEKARFFSEPGIRELLAMHQRIVEDLQKVSICLINDDPVAINKAKQWLKAQKNALAANDFLLLEKHAMRVEKGLSESIETSALHIELLTRFRRIDQLICGFATFEASEQALTRSDVF